MYEGLIDAPFIFSITFVAMVLGWCILRWWWCHMICSVAPHICILIVNQLDWKHLCRVWRAFRVTFMVAILAKKWNLLGLTHLYLYFKMVYSDPSVLRVYMYKKCTYTPTLGCYLQHWKVTLMNKKNVNIPFEMVLLPGGMSVFYLYFFSEIVRQNLPLFFFLGGILQCCCDSMLHDTSNTFPSI